MSFGNNLTPAKLLFKILPTTTEKLKINVAKLAGAYFNALYQK